MKKKVNTAIISSQKVCSSGKIPTGIDFPPNKSVEPEPSARTLSNEPCWNCIYTQTIPLCQTPEEVATMFWSKDSIRINRSHWRTLVLWRLRLCVSWNPQMTGFFNYYDNQEIAEELRQSVINFTLQASRKPDPTGSWHLNISSFILSQISFPSRELSFGRTADYHPDEPPLGRSELAWTIERRDGVILKNWKNSSNMGKSSFLYRSSLPLSLGHSYSDQEKRLFWI